MESVSRQRVHEELRPDKEDARLNAQSTSKLPHHQMCSPKMKRPRKEKGAHRGKMKAHLLGTLDLSEQQDQSHKKQ